jgi:hypothetical protein
MANRVALPFAAVNVAVVFASPVLAQPSNR